MGKITEKIKALDAFIEKLDEVVLNIVADHEAKIVEWVTGEQLYTQGVRGSDGVTIMSYAPYAESTVKRKTKKGQPTDRVTLRDTGEFHKKFTVSTDTEKFTISAENTDPALLPKFLAARYGDGIFNLTDENLNTLIETAITPNLLIAIKNIVDE